MLSCCALRVGGERPVLLQGSMGSNYRGSIQLTNPSADRNPDAKVHPDLGVAGRTIGISRDRLIGDDGMEERVRIVNHAERELAFTVELELGSDAADIFEVRGYPRPERGTLLPIALTLDPGHVPLRRARRDAPLDPRGVLGRRRGIRPDRPAIRRRGPPGRLDPVPLGRPAVAR